MPVRRFFILLWAPALLWAAGCSLDYRDPAAGETGEGVPTILMEKVTHSLVERGVLVMRVEAERTESHDEAKKILLFGVRFQEYDSRGEPVSRGRADRVEYFTDTKNAVISGNVEVVSHREKGGIRTDHLSWDNEKRVLKGLEHGRTETFDEEGSRFSGQGFEADLKRLVVTFAEAVEGDYAVPDE